MTTYCTPVSSSPNLSCCFQNSLPTRSVTTQDHITKYTLNTTRYKTKCIWESWSQGLYSDIKLLISTWCWLQVFSIYMYNGWDICKWLIQATNICYMYVLDLLWYPYVRTATHIPCRSRLRGWCGRRCTGPPARGGSCLPGSSPGLPGPSAAALGNHGDKMSIKRQ